MYKTKWYIFFTIVAAVFVFATMDRVSAESEAPLEDIYEVTSFLPDDTEETIEPIPEEESILEEIPPSSAKPEILDETPKEESPSTTSPILEEEISSLQPIPPPLAILPPEPPYLVLNSTLSTFVLSESPTFTFSLAFKKPEVEPTHTETFIDHVSAVTDVIVDTVNDVVENIGDTVDSFVGMTKWLFGIEEVSGQEPIPDAVEVTPDTATEIPVTNDVSPVLVDETETYAPENNEPVIAEKEEAPTNGFKVSVFIDGVERSDVYVERDLLAGTLTIQLPNSFGVLPHGTHRLRIVVSEEGISLSWEGSYTWGGELMDTFIVDDTSHVLLFKNMSGTHTLWFHTKDASGSRYTLLEERGMASDIPQSSIESGVLLFTSHTNDVLIGYDPVTQVLFSNLIEEKGSTPIVVKEGLYEVSSTENELTIVPYVSI